MLNTPREQRYSQRTKGKPASLILSLSLCVVPFFSMWLRSAVQLRDSVRSRGLERYSDTVEVQGEHVCVCS